MGLFDGTIDKALAAAKAAIAAGAPDWQFIKPPQQWTLTAGPLMLVVHESCTAPPVIDRDAKLSVFVALEGGARLEVGVVWAQTIARARVAGDRLLGIDREAGQ